MSDTEPDNASILAAINRLVEDRTFSAQATEAIAKLRERTANLEKDLASSTAQLDGVRKELAAALADNTKLRAVVDRVDAREKVLAAREEKVALLEQKAAVAEGQLAAYREVTGLVFRNLETRREMLGNVAPAASANPTYYPPATVPVNETVKETQT